jgi:hypothetical protein
MELLVKPEILTSCIYGPTFGNAESRLFLFAAQYFNIESNQKFFSVSQLCVNTLPATKITLITYSGVPRNFFGGFNKFS